MTVSHLTALLKKCVANGQCDFLTYGEFGQRYGFGGSTCHVCLSPMPGGWWAGGGWAWTHR